MRIRGINAYYFVQCTYSMQLYTLDWRKGSNVVTREDARGPQQTIKPVIVRSAARNHNYFSADTDVRGRLYEDMHRLRPARGYTADRQEPTCTYFMSFLKLFLMLYINSFIP